MKQSTVFQRTWWSAIGAVTAASTIVAGLAPVAQAAPTAPQRDNALRQHAADAADGTYESCGAYFGYGKREFGALDIVEFDVADQNGSDGVAHAVGSDTQVLLELKNASGDVIDCTPVEVTQKMWNDEMANDPLSYISTSAAHPLPAWPGPGHYIYPSVNFTPTIDNFGTVVSVGFKVPTFPAGHTLVSPTGVKPLVVHYPAGTSDNSNVLDPLVLDYLTSTAGPTAASAFQAALTSCGPGGDGGADFGTDLNAALDAMRAYQGFGASDSNNCYDVLNRNAEVSFLLNLNATVSYTEPIVLSLPETPATNPPTVIKPNVAKPATPVTVQPTYTG